MRYLLLKEKFKYSKNRAQNIVQLYSKKDYEVVLCNFINTYKYIQIIPYEVLIKHNFRS